MATEAPKRIARCKHRKPGDGGIVDGCGWQGERQTVCPSCGSKLLRLLQGQPGCACGDTGIIHEEHEPIERYCSCPIGIALKARESETGSP